MSAPHFSLRAACMSAISSSGDSISPPSASVSGKHFLMYDANFLSLASASAISSSSTTSWHTASTISKGRYLSLIQTVSFSSAMSLKTGSLSIISCAYGLIGMLHLPAALSSSPVAPAAIHSAVCYDLFSIQSLLFSGDSAPFAAASPPSSACCSSFTNETGSTVLALVIYAFPSLS